MDKKRFHIINNLFLDREGRILSIGGVETYIYNLCKVIINMGYTPKIYQCANSNFLKDYEGITVHGLFANDLKLVKAALKIIPEHEIVIFANDEVVYGKYNGIIINLQHGIGWDYQKHQYRGELFENYYRFLSSLDTRRRIKYSRLADYVVCVDYNYVNWFKTQVNYVNTNFRVIPNFTDTFERIPVKQNNVINIIFARRLIGYRGTRIFTDAVKQLLNEFPDVCVTYAGTGPDESWIKEQLKEYSRVNYITYNSTESLSVHADKHIAVVPSIGSEGTSLSLLEAMAAGCAVVCTNVGGMTNIVLDHYNGLIVEPKAEQLYQAIKELIQNSRLRERLSVKGFETASIAFSKQKWESSWSELIREIVECH